MTYSVHSVIDAIKHYFRVFSFRKVACLTSIPKSTIHYWVVRFHFAIIKSRDKRNHFRTTKIRKRQELIRGIQTELALQPFHTLSSLKFTLGTTLSLASISRAVNDAGFSRKKASWKVVPKCLDSEKHEFKNHIVRSIRDGKTIVALDETGFVSDLTPIMGYSPIGQRLKARKQLPSTRIRLSCCMAIDTSGNIEYEIKNGSYNGDSFHDFLQRIIPRSKSTLPTLVLDNIAFHKSQKVRSLVQQKGFVDIAFTPPYSPECNPIERLFGVIKHYVRKMLSKVTIVSREQLISIVDSAIQLVRTRSYVPSFFSMSEVRPS